MIEWKTDGGGRAWLRHCNQNIKYGVSHRKFYILGTESSNCVLFFWAANGTLPISILKTHRKSGLDDSAQYKCERSFGKLCKLTEATIILQKDVIQ